jgi:dihydropteroate synthase
MRTVFQWNLGSRTLELGKRTLIMGIVNVTPDSFSDGGSYLAENQRAPGQPLRQIPRKAETRPH